ncbi:hypothetical protein Dimus_007604 [Dionaea muscipula]
MAKRGRPKRVQASRSSPSRSVGGGRDVKSASSALILSDPAHVGNPILPGTSGSTVGAQDLGLGEADLLTEGEQCLIGEELSAEETDGGIGAAKTSTQIQAPAAPFPYLRAVQGDGGDDSQISNPLVGNRGTRRGLQLSNEEEREEELIIMPEDVADEHSFWDNALIGEIEAWEWQIVGDRRKGKQMEGGESNPPLELSQNQNVLLRIENDCQDGTRVCSKDDILEEIQSFYKGLLDTHSVYVIAVDNTTMREGRFLSSKHAEALVVPFTVEEVKSALWDIGTSIPASRVTQPQNPLMDMEEQYEEEQEQEQEQGFHGYGGEEMGASSGHVADPNSKDDLQELKRRLEEETEEVAGAVRKMQAQLEQDAGANQEDPANASAAAIQVAKEEVDSRSIYVGNVDYGCTPEEVQAHFQSCGTVNRVTILTDKYGQPKGFAYVEFLETEAVQNAQLLNESELHGRQLKVSAKRTNIPGMKQFRERRPSAFGGFRSRRPFIPGASPFSPYSYG